MKSLLPVLFFGLWSLAWAQGGLGSAVAENFEDDCRACHEAGVPDRHHLLYGRPIAQDSVVPYPDANGDGSPETHYGCLNCHDARFTVERNCVACHRTPVGTVPDGTYLSAPPLTVTLPELDALTLEWAPSCSVTDTDYAVYEGTLGNFASHIPVVCSTAGATTATIAPPAGSVYYLVVARNHWSEGSYGVDNNEIQRPPSASACLAQSIGCPWP